jgi:cobalt-zinc-cadmium efflux system outer membrane protein
MKSTPLRLTVLLLIAFPRFSGANDPASDNLTPLSLSEAIARVQAVAPQRRAAQARAEAATGVLYQAGRLPNPSIDIREENLNPSGGNRAPLDQTIDVFAVFNQPIETGGKRAARTAAAAAEVVAARAGVRQAERDLTIVTVHLYLSALQAYVFTKVLTNNRDDLQPLVAAMTRRVEEGYAAEADLMKFRAEAARLDTQLARARLEFDRNVTALGTLLALPGHINGSRLVEPPLIDPPTGDPSELAQHIVEHRPEIVAARARLEKARHTLELEQARRFPDPSVTAGYKRTGGENTLVAGVIVPLPLFDQNTGNIERAMAEERAATLDLDALTNQLTAETVSLILSAQELTDRARQIDQQLLAPAEVVRNAARSAFREGAANILQVVDAERVYTDARREALGLKLDAYLRSFEARLLIEEERPSYRSEK